MTEQVELELFLVAETEKAFGIRQDETDTTSELIWLPKSQVDSEENPQLNEITWFLVPEWLAVEKGLV